MYYDVIIGILLPLVGTSLGAAIVYIIRNDINYSINRFLFSIASGIMFAATVWSLILPALDYSNSYGILSFLPVLIGIFLGYTLMVLFERFSDDFHDYSEKQLKRFIYAVTLHNIPEGMAVGVAYASIFKETNIYDLNSAFILSIGIALQNIPEGSVISLPLFGCGLSKNKSFLYGFISGIVEPIAALVSFILCSYIKVLLPYFLALAAGTMIFVIIKDMIPKFCSENKYILFFIIGFNIMMILDVVFS